MPAITPLNFEAGHGALPASGLLAWTAIGLIAVALAGCDRRPGDPPKPSTASGGARVTAEVANLAVPDSARSAISPASDPPPSPIPQPAEPPASPASR